MVLALIKTVVYGTSRNERLTTPNIDWKGYFVEVVLLSTSCSGGMEPDRENYSQTIRCVVRLKALVI